MKAASHFGLLGEVGVAEDLWAAGAWASADAASKSERQTAVRRANQGGSLSGRDLGV